MLRTDRGDRAGASVGDPGRVDDRNRHPGAWVEEIEQRHLGWQAATIVIDKVADDLDARESERGNVAAQDVEMPVKRAVGDEMRARLDHGFAAPLRRELRLDRREDLVVGQREPRDVDTVKIVKMDLV